jgi:hypothetical protein
MIAQSYTAHTHMSFVHRFSDVTRRLLPPDDRKEKKKNKLPLLNKEKVPTQSSAPNALNKRKATAAAAKCNDVIFSSFFSPQILFREKLVWLCCCWFLFMMISAAPF